MDSSVRLYWSTAGSGGTAGKGGIVKYSQEGKINSYNGNRITEDNFDYETICYEYDKDGNLLDGTNGISEEASVVSYENDINRKIIPTKIFIQDGIRRAVYDNLCYMPEKRKTKYGVNGDISLERIKNTSSSGNVKCVRIIEEVNVPYSKQGIGSGAGYIELSNGTFEVMAETP